MARRRDCEGPRDPAAARTLTTMADNTSTLSMFLLEERPLAVKLTDKAAAVQGESRRIEWVPRSQISYARKQPKAADCDAQPYTFTLPDRIVEEKNLWSFVIA